MALERFSKHQKWILIALAVGLVLPMGVMGIWQRVLSERDQKVAELFGDDVTGMDLREFRNRWSTIARVNRPLAAQLELLEEGGLDRYFVLTRVALKSGIDVLDAEVAERARMLLRLDESTTQEQYAGLLSRQYQIQQVGVFEQALRELMACEKLMLYVARSIKVTDDELWRHYEDNFSKVKLDLVTLTANDFADDAAAPTEEEISSRYERDKETEWLMVPHRVKVEYAGALYSTWKDLVKIERADLEAYYDRKKADFVIEEPEGDPSAQSQPASDAGASSEEPVMRSLDEAAEKKKPRFKPFDEVKDEIEAIIRKRRAKEDATTIVMKARREAENQNVKEAAAQNGLIYGVTDWFSADEANAVPVVGGTLAGQYGDSQALGTVAFALEDVIGVCRNDKGAFAIRVIEDKPDYIPELAAVSDTIVERLVVEKRFQAAQSAAAGIVIAAQSGDFAEAVASLGKEDLKVETTPILDVWYPIPYADAAARSEAGAVSMTPDPNATPPVVYVWKVVERQQPPGDEFEKFKEFYGSMAVLGRKYVNLAVQIQSDINGFARWRRVDRKSSDDGDKAAPLDSRAE